jgi:hypothetical protein
MQLSDIVGDPAPLLAAWPTEPSGGSTLLTGSRSFSPWRR